MISLSESSLHSLLTEFFYSLHSSSLLLFGCSCSPTSSVPNIKRSNFLCFVLLCFATLQKVCPKYLPLDFSGRSSSARTGPCHPPTACQKTNPFPSPPVFSFFQIFSFFPSSLPTTTINPIFSFPDLFSSFLFFIYVLDVSTEDVNRNTQFVCKLSSTVPFPGAPEVSGSVSAPPLEAAETGGTNPVLRVMNFSGSWSPGQAHRDALQTTSNNNNNNN